MIRWFAAVMLLVFCSAVGAANNNLLFILDASGSMWGQIDGTPKISVAKSVMTGLVSDLPDDSKAGLLAYGHRRKGDCNDIETLVSLGPLQREAMIAPIDKLSPKGKTPITAAVQQAVQQVRQVEESVSLILVSDGLESCGGDPCAAVKTARDSGVDFKLHVVGFDLGDADPAQLQCMADAGGGEFVTAGNANELSEALERVSAPEPPVAEATITAQPSAVAGAALEVSWTGPDFAKDYIAVLERGAAGNRYINIAYTQKGSPASILMPPEAGAYDLVYVQYQGRKVLARQPLEVTPVEASITAPKTAVAGATLEVSWSGPDYPKDYIGVVERGAAGNRHINHRYTQDGSPASLTMPPEAGEYDIVYVQYQDRKVLARQPLEVTPVEASVTAPASAPAGASIEINWTGPDYAKDYIGVVERGAAGNRHINIAYTQKGSPASILMPPEAGEYDIVYVQYQDRKILARQPLEVTPVEASVTAPASAPAGASIEINWTGPDYAKDYIGVVERGVAGNRHINIAYTQKGSPASILMPPEAGAYDIVYVQYQDRKVLARQPLEVTPVEASVSAPASAAAGATIEVNWTGPDYTKDYIGVVERGAAGNRHINNTYTTDGSPASLLMPKKAGDYDIVYVQYQGRKVLSREPIVVDGTSP